MDREISEEEMYQDLMEIEEFVGHENITLNRQEQSDILVTLTYLISFFEEKEDYMKCKHLKDISEIVTNNSLID
jgi:hypothetical protein|tara:strand:- start:704 stop:925 length:222 start_codon:yes stop_codon:yes gene_type:complete